MKWRVAHYDIATGHSEIVITCTTQAEAERLLDFLVNQDHGTHDVYYVSQEEER